MTSCRSRKLLQLRRISSFVKVTATLRMRNVQPAQPSNAMPLSLGTTHHFAVAAHVARCSHLQFIVNGSTQLTLHNYDTHNCKLCKPNCKPSQVIGFKVQQQQQQHYKQLQQRRIINCSVRNNCLHILLAFNIFRFTAHAP